MRKLTYILLIFLLIISCKEHAMKSESNLDVAEEFIMEDEVIQISKINSLEALSIQKLNEYFDLLKLKVSHPDFEDDIIAQLKKYTTDSLFESDLGTDFKVENIQQIGEVQKLSDSISKIRLQFDIVFDNTRFKDSVFTKITSERIVIDGQEINSNEVLFLKE